MSATAKDHLGSSETVVLSAGSTPAVEVRLQPIANDTGEVGGQVRSDSGTVLNGVSVAATSNKGVTRSTSTDGQGRYTLGGLAEGSWTLVFSRSGFFSETRSVSVSGNSQAVDVVLTQHSSVPPDPVARLTRAEVVRETALEAGRVGIGSRALDDGDEIREGQVLRFEGAIDHGYDSSRWVLIQDGKVTTLALDGLGLTAFDAFLPGPARVELRAQRGTIQVSAGLDLVVVAHPRVVVPVIGEVRRSGNGYYVKPTHVGRAALSSDLNGVGGRNTDFGWVIIAPRGGTVVTSGWVNGYGWLVKIKWIDSEGRTHYSYLAHNSSLLVAEGIKVSAGQPVAILGNSGNSDTAHCHWEETIRRRREALAPRAGFPRHGRRGHADPADPGAGAEHGHERAGPPPAGGLGDPQPCSPHGFQEDPGGVGRQRVHRADRRGGGDLREYRPRGLPGVPSGECGSFSLPLPQPQRDYHGEETPAGRESVAAGDLSDHPPRQCDRRED